MWKDFNDWGEGDDDEHGYVVTFVRDRYTGPVDGDGIGPFLAPENYVAETRYVYIRAEIIADTADIAAAAVFASPHEAAGAIQWHRADCGDVGRMFEVVKLHGPANDNGDFDPWHGPLKPGLPPR